MKICMKPEGVALAYDIVSNKGNMAAVDYVQGCMIPAAEDHRGQYGAKALHDTVETSMGKYPIGLVLSSGLAIAQELDSVGYVK